MGGDCTPAKHTTGCGKLPLCNTALSIDNRYLLSIIGQNSVQNIPSITFLSEHSSYNGSKSVTILLWNGDAAPAAIGARILQMLNNYNN